MKRVMNGLGAALCAGALLATIGCDSIRDYSVNSYQGVMPVNDFRPSGSIALSKMPDKPNPSVPVPPPEAAPAASASPSSDTTTKPADSSK
jgi:hypothetical protein